jgi:hypothetical protein
LRLPSAADQQAWRRWRLQRRVRKWCPRTVPTATGTRGHRGLVGGDAIGDRDVFAVGYYRPLTADDAGSLEPIGGVVTGASWKASDVPDPPGPRATLTDTVSLGRDTAWAVGARLDRGRLRA